MIAKDPGAVEWFDIAADDVLGKAVGADADVSKADVVAQVNEKPPNEKWKYLTDPVDLEMEMLLDVARRKFLQKQLTLA